MPVKTRRASRGKTECVEPRAVVRMQEQRIDSDSEDAINSSLTARSCNHSEDYSSSGTFKSPHEMQAEAYIRNCRKYEVPVDPG